MKFNTGDRFKVIASGLRGRIANAGFCSIFRLEEYTVVWDSSPHMRTVYLANDCDDLWDFDVCPVIETNLPQGNDPFFRMYGGDQEDRSTPKAQAPEEENCHIHGHKWVEVGFHFTKTICKRCDKEQGNG